MFWYVGVCLGFVFGLLFFGGYLGWCCVIVLVWVLATSVLFLWVDRLLVAWSLGLVGAVGFGWFGWICCCLGFGVLLCDLDLVVHFLFGLVFAVCCGWVFGFDLLVYLL